MKCQFCGEPASVHLTEIVQNQKAELHLCDACAEKHQLWASPSQELNVPALLGLLLGGEPGDGGADSCPECGMNYDQFRARGRLGCPHDYALFGDRLDDLLDRIHRDHRHVGKSPARAGGAVPLAELRRRLEEAVAEEAFEEAARLRDLIRQQEGERPA